MSAIILLGATKSILIMLLFWASPFVIGFLIAPVIRDDGE